MKRLAQHLVCLLAKLVLALRYRVRVEGLQELRGMRSVLLLPNHPAHIDPPLMLATVWPVLKPRPMLLRRMFENPVLFWIPGLLNALEIPDLTKHSRESREQARRAIDAVVEGLQRGDNELLWPAGKVQRSGRESLGSARSVAEILSRAPETNVVLVRTRGLWGSRFSYARGDAPDLIANLKRGAGILLANLLLFAPRRTVTMTFHLVRPNEMPEPTRGALNPFLEGWYNAPGPETPTFVPYHPLFGPREHAFPEPVDETEVDYDVVSAETREAVADLVEGKIEHITAGELADPATDLDALGLDSLDRMELALAIERRFGFAGDQVPVTVGDLWILAEGRAATAPPKPPPPEWFNDIEGPVDLRILGSTLGEAFVERAVRHRKDIAVADDLSGVLTYERMLIGAYLMSRRFERIDAPNVGVLLPASVATSLVFYGLHLAGKLPVLLNWTTGPGNLAHAAATMGLSHVVTSKAFVDRTGVAIEGIRYVFLEDVRGGIGTLDKLLALARVRLAPRGIARRMGRVDFDDPAVVLFTSGSEKAPKAVPLSHRNILSNLEGIAASFDVTRRDTIMGFLPAFHSFGLTVTTLLPTLCGCRTVYHPDPTDASAIVQKIRLYRTSIVCGTPTFLSFLLDRADDGDLDALRLAVVGAEKCPDAVFQRVASDAPSAAVLEGYGITECSPLIAANRPGKTRQGTVGVPLEGVEVIVVDPETHAPLPQGEVGMLLVHGDNVFAGYIDHDGPPPFAEIDDRRWYVTGDLCRIDEDGFIHFAGRLKRFLKAGGEMISLPALEEPFAVQFPADEDGPQVAVEGIETDGGRRIVLFTRQPMGVREANDILHGAGMTGVMRIDEVREIDAIPVLGTGKTDYKQLRAMIEVPEPDAV